MPVAAIRSAVDAREGAYSPLPDLEGFDNDVCPRRGVWGHCALTQLVSDYQSRPVLAVSHLHEITGVGEYDAFGFRNRVSLPAAVIAQNWDVENLGKLPVGGLDSDFRLRVAFVDAPVSSCSWCWPPSMPGSVEVHDSSGMLSTAYGAYPSIVSDWHVGTDFTAVFNPHTSSGPGAAVLQGFEYDRRNSGARYVPPLRFPGQYYDEETDLHENWNRFYDPATGGYTTTESFLQSPRCLRRMARNGVSVPVYAYAANNPLRYVDFDGLALKMGGWTKLMFPEKVAALQQAIDRLNNPSKECQCGLSGGGAYDKAAWEDRDIVVNVDWLPGLNGWTDPLSGQILVDSSLSSLQYEGTIAHEGGI